MYVNPGSPDITRVFLWLRFNQEGYKITTWLKFNIVEPTVYSIDGYSLKMLAGQQKCVVSRFCYIWDR